mmetsp:Transcript_137961/g.243302  ORF Transcript_137961/g.243302 Transcript_137961/m.243302 type:complete len:232 (+) Transcript_137961:381-1076(+)
MPRRVQSQGVRISRSHGLEHESCRTTSAQDSWLEGCLQVTSAKLALAIVTPSDEPPSCRTEQHEASSGSNVSDALLEALNAARTELSSEFGAETQAAASTQSKSKHLSLAAHHRTEAAATRRLDYAGPQNLQAQLPRRGLPAVTHVARLPPAKWLHLLQLTPTTPGFSSARAEELCHQSWSGNVRNATQTTGRSVTPGVKPTVAGNRQGVSSEHIATYCNLHDSHPGGEGV